MWLFAFDADEAWLYFARAADDGEHWPTIFDGWEALYPCGTPHPPSTVSRREFASIPFWSFKDVRDGRERPLD